MKSPIKNSILVLALTAGLSFMQPARVAAQIISTQAVVSVSVGESHCLFVMADRSLWGMGDNHFGQLGLGSTITNVNLPHVIVPSGVGSIAGGYLHSLYTSGTTLWAMGINSFGQLGDGSTTTSYTPEQVLSLFHISIFPIAAGGNHSVFGTSGLLFGTATMRSMGLNNHGQLGDTTTANHSTPETVLPSVPLAIACGANHTLYIDSAHNVWSMGLNSDGQLGQSGFVDQPTPGNISAAGQPTNCIAIAAGLAHSAFVDSDGNLWGVGSQAEGQFGDTNFPSFDIPALFVVGGCTSVAAGYYHTVFIRNGGLWGMGYNAFGQLGDGTNDIRSAFPIVSSNVVAVAAGGYDTFFIKSDGSLWGMGRNLEGELGTGDYTNRFSPVEIIGPPPPLLTNTPSGTNVVVSWSTNALLFHLQSGPSATGPYTNVPGATTPWTNPINVPQQFYRLSQ